MAGTSLAGLRWNFVDVNEFCKETCTKHEAKGFKYYNEKYVHDISVAPVDQQGNGVTCLHVAARCHHSYKKNDSPHSLGCDIVMTDGSSSACSCFCTCAIGQSGCCGHIIGLLFQLAQYTMLKFTKVPAVVSCTSLLQQWHKPRGSKIKAIRTDDMELASSSQGKEKERPVRTTLYNPIANCQLPNFDNFLSGLQEVNPNCQWLTMPPDTSDVVISKFGSVPKGSILSYQQMPEESYVLKYPGVEFPELPIQNLLVPIRASLTHEQTHRIEALKITPEESVMFEKETRSQSDSSLWHKLRENRLTSSRIGQICKRRKAYETLVVQLKKKTHATTAMKEGLLREPIAAETYAKAMNDEVNLYPCGIVVSPYVPWIAASPDRKVYCPGRQPSFGLLEIKCPQNDKLHEVACLQLHDGSLQLKRGHDYYYQIQCQLAVTGLSWCDLFVYLSNGLHHMETISFDKGFWNSNQCKVDDFYLSHFK